MLNIAIYVLGSLILSALNVLIGCLLCWMVHKMYSSPSWLQAFVKLYLRKMHPPKKSADDFDIAEKELAEIRKTFITNLGQVKRDSKVLNDELAALLIPENEPVLESIRMTEMIGKTKEVLSEMEKEKVSALEKGGRAGEICSSSAAVNAETADSLLKQMRTIQLEMNGHLHYLALQKMLGNIDPEKTGQEEMKQVAIVVNHLTGIILGTLNIALFIYTTVKMFSDMQE